MAQAGESFVVAVPGRGPVFEHLVDTPVSAYGCKGSMRFDETSHKPVSIIQIVRHAVGAEKNCDALFLRQQQIPPVVRGDIGRKRCGDVGETLRLVFR